MQSNRTPTEALEAALQVAFAGSPTRMADELGVSYQTVNLWRKGREGRPVQVPPQYCPRLERLTERKVRCEELRPDVDWGFVRAQAGDCCCDQPKAV
jgi:DNA-binding transcriptional regulator YdaS (Cro superfamily)